MKNDDERYTAEPQRKIKVKTCQALRETWQVCQ
jgi:hypothetical protein